MLKLGQTGFSCFPVGQPLLAFVQNQKAVIACQFDAPLLCRGHCFFLTIHTGDEDMAAETVVGRVFVNEEHPLPTR